jgi:2-iminobutanoate/2-iminopropanoate deaminase
MSKKQITSDKIAKPAGPFSPAISGSGVLFLSGQIGQDPATGKVVEGGVEAETRQIFANLRNVLEAAGKSFADVARVGVYLTDMADFGKVNVIYGENFPQPYPARTCIAVAALPLGAKVELDLMALD